jgi:hypothetical protein
MRAQRGLESRTTTSFGTMGIRSAGYGWIKAPWEWQITIPMAMPEWACGTTISLDESKRAFAAAWGRLLQETSVARLERAWELGRAVEARQRRMEMVGNDSA